MALGGAPTPNKRQQLASIGVIASDAFGIAEQARAPDEDQWPRRLDEEHAGYRAAESAAKQAEELAQYRAVFGSLDDVAGLIPSAITLSSAYS